MKALPVRAFCIALFLLLPLSSVKASTFQQGLDAYDSGNYAAALRIFVRLAEQGDALAQNNLGVMYESGRGVTQNHREAVRWYRLAAEQGNADAQNNLGGMYAEGQGVPQNHREAVHWYRLAAEQGNAFAQFNLGLMYGTGKGVTENYIQAHKWFNLAAANGNASAAEPRNIVAGLMTQAQIAEAQRLAAEWMNQYNQRTR